MFVNIDLEEITEVVEQYSILCKIDNGLCGETSWTPHVQHVQDINCELGMHSCSRGEVYLIFV